MPKNSDTLRAMNFSLFKNQQSALIVACCLLLGSLQVSAESESPWLQRNLSNADAIHLLSRTGFGASLDQINNLQGMSRREAVQHIVDGLTTAPKVPMPEWVNAPAPRYWARGLLEEKQKRAFDQTRDREINELRQWWINNMLTTDSPQSERLVFFWHDHFATSYHGVSRQSTSMARQNQTFRQLGLGSYRELLLAMIRDPALLQFLNNQSSNKRKPNENLARELLELFTLGEGEYSETTVKQAARALTGYGYSPRHNMSFMLAGYKRDMAPKTIFGVTAVHDGDSLVELILEQPAAAQYLVTRFWHAFISDATPDPEFVRKLAQRFRLSDYQLQALYTDMLNSEAFWADENRLSLVKSPLTLLVGSARTLDYPKKHWTKFPSVLALLGMDLFAPPNVSGWTEGGAFVTPGRLLNRQLALSDVVLDGFEHGSDGSNASGDTKSNSMANNSGMASTMGPSNSMQSGDMLSATSSTGAMMESATPSSEKTVQVMEVHARPQQRTMQVRFAAHDYKGAPEFTVSLLDGNDSLWSSEVIQAQQGIDTERFGKTTMSLLTWEDIVLSVDENALAQANQISIDFINDAAGPSGDRNLFIDGAFLNGQLMSASTGTNHTRCPPKNPGNAGRMYCGGKLSIPLSTNLAIEGKVSGSLEQTGYQAAEARIFWSNKRKSRIVTTVSLEDFVTPEVFFNTFSFSIVSNDVDQLAVQLSSFGCSTECVEKWPACAWQEKNSPAQKYLFFPLEETNDEQLRCHYDSLQVHEKKLIDVLKTNAMSLLAYVNETAIRKRDIDTVAHWQQRIAQMASVNLNGGAATTAVNIISENYVNKDTVFKPTFFQKPTITYTNGWAVNDMAHQSAASISELILTGADAGDISGLEDLHSLPVAQQIEKIIAHPVFQVY